jgi:hypothetical protein
MFFNKMDRRFIIDPRAILFSDFMKGPQGDIGFSGLLGITGTTGLIGKIGKIGETGNQGLTGNIGERGLDGPIGNKGERGDTGGIEPVGNFQGEYHYWNTDQNKWVIGSENISLGGNSGKNNQGLNAISIGYNAGLNNQGVKSVAIGNESGLFQQGDYSVSIGYKAGLTSLGKNSIAIGTYAGTSGQADYSILLNSTGNPLTVDSSGTYVSPIRNSEMIDENCYYLFYNDSTKEIFYDSSQNIPFYQKIIIEQSGTYQLPTGVKRVYITAVGGGGGGGCGSPTFFSEGFSNTFFRTAGGGGGGSGGCVYKLPIDIIDSSFSVVIGQGGFGNSSRQDGTNGGTTSITYKTYNNRIKNIYLGGGGGGTRGYFLPPTVSIQGNALYYTWSNGIGGAGGSISFSENDVVNANGTNGSSANTTFLFDSPDGILNERGKNGTITFPFISGSSGGSVYGNGETGDKDLRPNTFNGSEGGDCNGFYKGGIGGNKSSYIGSFFYYGTLLNNIQYENCGGGGGAGSIFSKGGTGGNELPNLLNAGYGAGGGGGSLYPSGNGGNGLVIIEWW